jgi:glycosyltransferase involved in cell wall biosynthesis
MFDFDSKFVSEKKPLVSCITIFLNAEKFIEEAIESVLAQTYSNWELLLVDDGSTDMSTNIALRYVENYPEKIKYIEHKDHQNLGMCASRNLGIRWSKGAYIALLDADDVWLPKKLEDQVAIMESHPEVGMVYGPVLSWFSWKDNREYDDFLIELAAEPNTIIKPPELMTVYAPLGPIDLPCLSNILARRDLVVRVGGFDEAFGLLPRGLCEDQPFFSKIHLKTPVFISDQCWTKYRIHSDSAVSRVIKEKYFNKAELFFLNWLEDYLRKEKVEQENIWQALKLALWHYRHPFLYSLTGRARKFRRQMKWLLFHKYWIKVAKLKRSIFRSRDGAITALPNPVPVQYHNRFPILTGETTLSWSSIGTETVEVHINSPDGPLFSRSGPSGKASTGKWVRDGIVFYLQDVSGVGKPLTLSNTLDAIRVGVFHERN